jgi:DHA1 family bicyclomycin/chloramphenicol resistance-like MFS transporter
MTVDSRGKLSSQNIVIMILITGLVMLGSVPLDVMLPSYPDLAAHFHTKVADISFSISIFAFGFAVAQLFTGPLSDRFGRKRLLICALLLAIGGTSGAALSHDYGMFLVFRVIQALGCSCFVLAQAIVQDAFKGTSGVKARIYITTANGLFIAFSPLIGTYLQAALGWRGSFMFFFIVAVIVLLVTYLSYEDKSLRSDGGFRYYANAYLQMFRHRQFVGYWIIGSLAFSCHFVFIIVSPLLFLDGMKMDATQYSFILLGYGIAYITGGVVASKIIRRASTGRSIAAGLVVIGVAAVLMVSLLKVSGVTTTSIMLPMLLCTIGTTVVRPGAATEAMSVFNENSGTAAAAGGTIRLVVGGGVSALVAIIGASVVTNLAILLAVSSVAGLIILVVVSAREYPDVQNM